MKCCAYIRVSTKNINQETSYEYQYEYWNRTLSKQGNEFIGIYSDKKSGCDILSRPGFLQMLNDARQKKFDIIYIKSISRLSRNIVDFLSIINELRNLGINIHFDKENLDTIDSKSQFILSIIARINEEERISTSQNERWRFKKQFAQGIPRKSFKGCYGYRMDETGHLQIVEDEAIVLRKIFNLYNDGLSSVKIMNWLKEHKIKSPSRKEVWLSSCITEILRNRIYVGDLILQKFIIIKNKLLRNIGSRYADTYLIQNDHQAIIEKSLFQNVQEILNKRRQDIEKKLLIKRNYYEFYHKIICGVCKKSFIEVVKRKKIVYKCNSQYRTACSSNQVTLEYLKIEFSKAYCEAQKFIDNNLFNEAKQKIYSLRQYEKQLDYQYNKFLINSKYYKDEKEKIIDSIEKQNEILSKEKIINYDEKYRENDIKYFIDKFLDKIIVYDNYQIEILFNNGYVYKCSNKPIRIQDQKNLDAKFKNKVFIKEREKPISMRINNAGLKLFSVFIKGREYIISNNLIENNYYRIIENNNIDPMLEVEKIVFNPFEKELTYFFKNGRDYSIRYNIKQESESEKDLKHLLEDKVFVSSLNLQMNYTIKKNGVENFTKRKNNITYSIGYKTLKNIYYNIIRGQHNLGNLKKIEFNGENRDLTYIFEKQSIVYERSNKNGITTKKCANYSSKK